MKKIVIASANSGKLKEIKEIIQNKNVRFLSMQEQLGYSPNIPETGSTFLENACIKADWVYEHTGIWTLADDSGLEVDALHGEPGVLSARYAGDLADSKANNQKLLQALDGYSLEKRTARFRCCVVLKTSSDAVISAEGVCEGKIIMSLQGAGGFGYDPLFIPDGYEKTFAQLDSLVKHQISHRGAALRELKKKMDHLYE